MNDPVPHRGAGNGAISHDVAAPGRTATGSAQAAPNAANAHPVA